jgi:glycosyltransferase involved in cell wall biosynthesis
MSATTRARYEWTFLRGAERASRDLAAVDLVVGVVPALAGAWAAQTLAGRQRVPYAVIVQDLMGKAASQSGIRGGGPVSGLVSWAERRALRGVARVATVSQPMLKSLEAYGVSSDRTTCLPNYTHIEVPDVSRQEARRHLGWSVEPFIALHTGNMGYKQDLENVIEAARLGAGQEGLDFVLLGDGSQRSRLEELARDVPRVRIMDPLPEDLYALALRAADVLLVNERSSVADMCLPSKLTSYLASRRPVVAAVPANGGTASLVQESGGGVVVPAADPAALFQSVQRLKADPRLAKELGERGNVYAQTRLTRQRGLAATREFLVRAALGA